MIRSELGARLAAQNTHLYDYEAERVVDTIIDRIIEALVAGDRVELRNFGIFDTQHQDARAGRNPRTGAMIEIEAKAKVRFRPGRAMQARLNLKSEGVGEIRRRRRAS